MSLTAYLKPTNFCSIDCDHCYLSEEIRADKNKMTDDVIKKTASMLMDLALREHQDSLHIIWHGGEPMMLNPDWYYHAISIIDSEIGKEKYTQSIQTSLIPYKSTWKNLIHDRFDSFVGSSIDFSQRKIKSSSSNYIDLWLKKVELAKEDSIEVIPSIVPTKFELKKGKKIVDWFERHDFSAFNIERFSEYGGVDISYPSNKEHSYFMKEILDSVLAKLKAGQRVSRINVIIAAINGVLFNLPGDRWGGSCQRDFIVVEPDGSLNSCPDRSSHESSFSNVNEGARGFIKSDLRRKWIRVQASEHKKSYCHECEFNYWCKSGCPITKNGYLDGENDCSGYKIFLNYLKDLMLNEKNRALLLDYAKPLGQDIKSKEKLFDS